MSDVQQRIEQLEKEIDRLKGQLVTDELTRIFNRRGLIQNLTPFFKEVLYQLSNPERRKSLILRHLSIIFVDIDHFKKINDTYGHAAGDAALKSASKLLKEHVREIDIVGRYGGEEIVIGLIGASSRDAGLIAENLRKKIEENSVSFEGQQIQMTASFGVSSLEMGMELNELIDKADQALYKAKKTGRNKVVVAK
jgi:diguanylate cyclase (GGDEF)-like protein